MCIHIKLLKFSLEFIRVYVWDWLTSLSIVVTICYNLIEKKLDLYGFFFLYYIVRFEIVRGWVTGHTEMTNDLRNFAG